jgi:ABC-type bacteriocin/lantibiotic exporter with double-glycine peptidase domain
MTRRLIWLQLLAIFSYLIDLILLSYVGAELSGNSSFIHQVNLLLSGNIDGYFVYTLIITMLVTNLLLTNIINYFQSLNASKLGVYLSDKIYSGHFNRPLIEIMRLSSGNFVNLLLVDVVRVTNSILIPSFLLIPRIVGAAILLTYLTIENANASLLALMILVFFLCFYNIIKNTLTSSSAILQNSLEARTNIINTSLRQARAVKIDRKLPSLLRSLQQHGENFAMAISKNQTLSSFPKTFIEYSLMGVVVISSFMISPENVAILGGPILIVIGVTLRMLPGIQLAFLFFSALKANRASLESVEQALRNSNTCDVRQQFAKHKLTLESEANPIRNLSIMGLNFSYDGTKIIKNLNFYHDFSVPLYIVGPSGSGKSTLLDLLTGLLKVQSGQIMYSEKLSPEELLANEKFTYVGADDFIPECNLTDLFNIPRGGTPECLRLLEFLELNFIAQEISERGDFAINEFGANISRGQKQRLLLIKSVLSSKPVVLLDEVASGLDRRMVRKMKSLISVYSDRLSFVIISHDENFIIKSRDNVICLS